MYRGANKNCGNNDNNNTKPTFWRTLETVLLAQQEILDVAENLRLLVHRALLKDLLVKILHIPANDEIRELEEVVPCCAWVWRAISLREWQDGKAKAVCGRVE